MIKCYIRVIIFPCVFNYCLRFLAQIDERAKTDYTNKALDVLNVLAANKLVAKI